MTLESGGALKVDIVLPQTEESKSSVQNTDSHMQQHMRGDIARHARHVKGSIHICLHRCERMHDRTQTHLI